MTCNGKFKLLIKSFQTPRVFMLNKRHVGGHQAEFNHFFKTLDV